MTERKQLEEAIAALDGKRGILGDPVVDKALALLHERLDALDAKSKTGAHIAIQPTALRAGERRVVTADQRPALEVLVRDRLAPAVALLPALLAIQLALTTGLAWCLAPLQVFLRDTRHLVGIALSLGFWITPIFYAPRRLPDALGFLHDANPMAQLIAAQRAILLHGTLPDAAPLALVAGLSLVLLVAGFAVFHATQHALAERV